MKVILLFILTMTTSAFAYNPMGGSFINSKTKEKVTLTCLNNEVTSTCEEAYFTLVKDDNIEVLHSTHFIPMIATQDAHYERYYMFYVLRDRLIEARAIGPAAWVVINGMKISKNFKQAVKIMFTKNEADFGKEIKMTNKNFSKMVEIIRAIY